MTETSYTVNPIGFVRSSITNREDAAKQADEGAPEAWIEILPDKAEGLEGIKPGDEIIILTWLHLGARDILKVHPRGNPVNPLTGVFATRSPNRPNPIGLHRVTVTDVEKQRIKVISIEAIDGTPVIDIKPILGNIGER